MSYESKHRVKENLGMIPWILVYIIIQIAIIVMQLRQQTMFNGVMSALQYGTCLLIVRSNRKKGAAVSTILMGLTSLLLLQAIVFSGQLTAVPGLCNMIFYIITMLILARYNMRREREAITDYLTGILNRRGLYKHLRERIKTEEKFSIIYFGIGNFKAINDNYGHLYGDKLLIEIANRMSNFVKEKGVIARVGGTEFIVVLDGELDAMQTANDLLKRIKEKTTLAFGGNFIDVYTECHAGLAIYPKDATGYEELIKYADMSLIEAVANKSEEVCVFDKKFVERMNRQLEIEKLIKESLENDYFYMVYQPQYNLDEKHLRGFESLIRMKTPDGQVISPGEFIPIAEKSDMIIQIDDYVLRRVMTEFSDIVNDKKELSISVNVSAKNIGGESFVEKIKGILDETQFCASNLEIEITEYCMADSIEVTIRNITELRNMGIQVALDDFGTGYTSLHNVAKLPINLLKVDKSLIDDIEKNEKNREFVHTVISMGHLMGCEVISEGVEEETQLDYLRNDGCDFVQGYVWGKPLDYDVARELLLE
ncbi:MAG: bifunctional diguanylate cyclase/phosphodiesterase [Lachnospiraceae bacterium]|nr:bifunctional diguanylate cyclase/phosphodiesterase [Lachnospiraceae bacterium]